MSTAELKTVDNEREPASGGHNILSISIKDLSVLYSSYMPFIENGGLFIPTTRKYEIDEEVFILLTLMEETEKIPVAGTVVWLTPHQSQGNRAEGIGIRFKEKDNEVRSRIEHYLAGMLNSDKPTHTL